MTKKAIIYARVSSVRQAEDGLPVESQIEQCKAKAASLGAAVVQVFRDDGISGRTTRRPAFLEAIEFCERSQVDFFVCWSTSRFARNRLDAALNKRLLEKLNTRLVYASQDFGETDDSWLAEAIIEVMDEQLSRTIAKDTRRSMQKNAADGYWNGGRAPYGYESVPSEDGKRRRLQVVEPEAAIVRIAYRMYLSGSGSKDVAQYLNHAGLLRRGAAWSKNTMRAMLTNPAVKGWTRWRDQGREISTQAHAPIVTEQEFEAVIETMKARAPENVGGRPKSEAVFSGMLRCGHCGEAMMTESATGRAGTRYHYYNCRSYLHGIGGCESRRVPVAAVDSALVAAICDRVFTAGNIRGLVVELRQQSTDFERQKQARIDAFAAELADVDRRLRRLYESIEADAGLELGDVAPRIRELRARQENLKRAADAVALEFGPEVSMEDGDVWEAARTLRNVVETSEEPAKLRAFMQKIVKKASLQGDEVTLDYWPESIVAALGGSQCGVKWLPEVATGRTKRIVIKLDLLKGRRAA